MDDSSEQVYQRHLVDAASLHDRRSQPTTIRNVPGGCLRPVREPKQESDDPASIGHGRAMEETTWYKQHVEQGSDPYLSTIGVRSQIREGARWEEQDAGWEAPHPTFPPLPILAAEKGGAIPGVKNSHTAIAIALGVVAVAAVAAAGYRMYQRQ